MQEYVKNNSQLFCYRGSWQIEEFLLKREKLNFRIEHFEIFVNKLPGHDINKNLVKSVFNEIVEVNS